MQAKLPTVTPTGKASMGGSFAHSPNNSKIVAGKASEDGQALAPDAAALTAKEASVGVDGAAGPNSPKSSNQVVNNTGNLDLVKAQDLLPPSNGNKQRRDVSNKDLASS